MENTESPLNVSTTQFKIAEVARKYDIVKSVNHHITRAWLREAFKKTRKDGAKGIDGKGAEAFEVDLDRNLDELVSECKSGKYRAPAVRRAYIPKGKNEHRGLGIPTFSDKVLQRGVAMILEPIYETVFYDCSYGFRPGKSAHDCVRDIRQGIHEFSGCYVLDVDISKYFDMIPHSKLREVLGLKVQDGVINRMIAKWLKAGVMENGNVSFSDTGTPQGGVISPLISNVYLHHVLDEWFHQTVKAHSTGRVKLFRYADDFIVLCSSKNDVERIMSALVNRFCRYGLELNSSKSKVVNFSRPRKGEPGETFDFLGFTFHWGRNGKGTSVVRVKTEKSRFSRSLKRFNELCRRMQHWDIRDQVARLNRSLVGTFNYYGVAFNQRGVFSLRYYVIGIWRYWLSRRSQKRKMPWWKFKQLRKTIKIAYPKRMVPLW